MYTYGQGKSKKEIKEKREGKLRLFELRKRG